MGPLPRHFRVAAVALLVALALALAALWLGIPRLKDAIRSRIEHLAAGRGLVAHVEVVHVGVWPLIELRGVRLERPAAWSLAVDTVELRPRLGGSGLLGRMRVALGRMTLIAASGLRLKTVPTSWDIAAAPSGSVRAELHKPAEGLAATWLPLVNGTRIELSAKEVPVGRLLVVQRENVSMLDAGTIEGTLSIASLPGSIAFDADGTGRSVRVAPLSSDAFPADEAFGPPTDVTLRFRGSWHPGEGSLEFPQWWVKTDGAAVSGSLAVSNIPEDPRVDLSLEVERADFARLLQASGAGEPKAAVLRDDGTIPESDLGSASLSARVSGRLADPASFIVSQRLSFTPPRHVLPAIERLRGDFVHEVLLPAGTRKTIRVSPASPDFIALPDVPPLFVRALLLAEDAGYFGHKGLDLSEVPSAVLSNWARGGAARGASTITQQLAKNLFLSREKRMSRKLQELSLALLLDATLGKERILEIYLNVIEWGPGLYGLRPAARRYFHKEPGELTPRQMAFLVALIPGPVKYQRLFTDGVPSPGFSLLVDDLLVKLRSVDAVGEEEYRAALAEGLLIDKANPEQTPDTILPAPSQTSDPQ